MERRCSRNARVYEPRNAEGLRDQVEASLATRDDSNDGRYCYEVVKMLTPLFPSDKLQPLRLALARTILGTVRGDEYVTMATELLAGGVESPSLKILAALGDTRSEEAALLVQRVQSELKLPSPSPPEAALAVACDHARRIVSGRLTPRDGANAIGTDAFAIARPMFDLSAFKAEADSIDESLAHRHRDPAYYDGLIKAAEDSIRVAAKTLLDGHPEL